MEYHFSLDQLNETVKVFWSRYGDRKIFAFRGMMGAGKTTFIHALTQYLGVKDSVSSPTFSIINEYVSELGDTIYHLDLYRLKDRNEALDIGIDELLHSESICLIEWPDIISSDLPKGTVWLDITIHSSDQRQIKVTEAE